ncbi:unnamed protein product [Protopolystoma xenopodis]|uniref:Uncharacterized protein n=1 Tax=Protopolystoma xenopodis TaxID=117903 RepID=A0A448X208_9PLAT|nr:unnamed protein product [Protopolystoma xenopodis]
MRTLSTDSVESMLLRCRNLGFQPSGFREIGPLTGLFDGTQSHRTPGPPGPPPVLQAGLKAKLSHRRSLHCLPLLVLNVPKLPSRPRVPP